MANCKPYPAAPNAAVDTSVRNTWHDGGHLELKSDACHDESDIHTGLKETVVPIIMLYNETEAFKNANYSFKIHAHYNFVGSKDHTQTIADCQTTPQPDQNPPVLIELIIGRGKFGHDLEYVVRLTLSVVDENNQEHVCGTMHRLDNHKTCAYMTNLYPFSLTDINAQCGINL